MKKILLFVFAALSLSGAPRPSYSGYVDTSYLAQQVDAPGGVLTGAPTHQIESPWDGTNFVFGIYVFDPANLWARGYSVASGSGISYNSTTEQLTFGINSATQAAIDAISLTPGPKGDTGLTGATGAIGVRGDSGTNGTNGSTGAQGDKGDKGDKGDTGTAGSNGTNGTTGTQGIQGGTGSTGATGSQGIQGSTGPTGADGALSIQRTRAQTDTSGVYAWTYPNAYGSGVIPRISALAEGVNTSTWSVQITSVGNTSATFQVTRTTPVTILGISVLGASASPQAYLHLTAIAP